jgi:hypothetical protein
MPSSSAVVVELSEERERRTEAVLAEMAAARARFSTGESFEPGAEFDPTDSIAFRLLEPVMALWIAIMLVWLAWEIKDLILGL